MFRDADQVMPAQYLMEDDAVGETAEPKPEHDAGLDQWVPNHKIFIHGDKGIIDLKRGVCKPRRRVVPRVDYDNLWLRMTVGGGLRD